MGTRTESLQRGYARVPAASAFDLDVLRELVRPVDARFTTVYLASFVDDVAGRAAEPQARWHAIAYRLADHGAPDADVDAVGRYLALSAPAEGVVIAHEGQVVLAQPLAGTVPADIAWYGAPPALGPLLAVRQRRPAYVLAALEPDRTTIETVPAGATAAASISTTVDRPVDAVRARLAETGADLLLLAGGPGVVHVADQVRGADRRITVRLLPADPAPERDAAIQRARSEYATAVTMSMRAAVDAFAVPHSTTVQGVCATLAALSVGKVETLLVVDDPRDVRVAWFGTGELCAALPDPVRPDRTRSRGRLVDVAVRAALLTDAHIRVLAADQVRGLRGGLAGICR